MQYFLGGTSLTIAFRQSGAQGLAGDVKDGHNFRCPLKSPLSVDPLVNGTTLIFNV
jgi:hypothetical protein